MTDKWSMKIFLCTIAVFLFLTIDSRSSPGELAQPSARKIEYIQKSNVKADKAYQNALGFFSKNFKDANSAIKLRDEKNKRIISSASIPCNALRPGYLTLDFYVRANLDFQSKDGRFRLLIEDAEIVSSEGTHAYVGQIESASDMAKVKTECLDPIEDQISKTMHEDPVEKSW